MNKLLQTYQRFLNWGERRLRTDIRYILHGGFWLFLGQASGVGTALVLAIVYAHYLPKETYGTYKYILSILGTLALLTMTGMDGGVQKGVARGREGIFWQAFKYRLGGGVISTLVTCGIGLFYYVQGNTLLSAIFFACAPFLVIMEPLGLYGALLVGKKAFRASSIYMLLLQLGTAGAIVTAVIFSQSLFVLILAYVMSNVFFRIILFMAATRSFPMNNTPDPEALSFGKHCTALAILGSLSSRLDSILLFHFLGPVPLAIYSFAQAATNNIRASFKLITDTLAFPKFAGQDKELLKKTLLRKVYIAHAVTIPLAGVAMLLIPLLYRLLFPSYMESIPYAQVMTAFLAFSPLRFISTSVNAQASTKIYYTMNITGTLTGTIALLVCIPLWGIWGAVIALGIQQSISNALGIYLFKRM